MKTKIKNILRLFYAPFRFLYAKPLDFYLTYRHKMLNPVQKQFAEKLSFFKSDTKGSNGVLLVQMVENYEYALKLAAASKVLAEKYHLRVNFYYVLIDWIKENIVKKSIYEKANKKKLNKIYSSFGDKMIFDNEEKYKDQLFIEKKLTEIINTLDRNNGVAILDVKFDGILVGDLIYDTYLRFFHQPTLEKIDNDVVHIIEVALNVFYNFKLFLKSNNVKVLLNTYSSYIHHGIPARICLNSNIEVYTLGSYSYVIQKTSNDFPYHQINHTLFSPDKKLSPLQLELAKNTFTARFKGKIDAATSYMRQSAFSNNPLSPEVRNLFSKEPRNIVIYVHDFYDSPHMFRVLQFPDFYQFLKQVLGALTDIEGTSVFIKIHPNGIAGCKEKTIELVNSFDRNYFHILDESVSNLHIIELKPDLIVTANGTVGIEMAYFEIPTVALHDNLYVNFNFVHSCTDKETYYAILKGEKKPIIDFDKERMYSFYYQTYIERIEYDKKNILNTLHSYKENTFADKYLEFILSNSKELFSDDFTKLYSNVLN